MKESSPRFSGAARDHLPWALTAVALVIAVIGLATMLSALGTALEYRRDLLLQQPWRAVTAHLVHVNGQHALLNLLAWALLLGLFRDTLTLRRQLLLFPAAGSAIALGLALLFPEIAWYRGLSGVLHSLFFAAATGLLLSALPHAGRTVWWPVLLLSGGAIKIALERPFTARLEYAEWLGAAVVPQAHLVGALAGVVAALLFARRRRPARDAG